MEKVTYSINQYDDKGDSFDNCILIHIGNTILRFDNLAQLLKFEKEIEVCITQIEEEIL